MPGSTPAATMSVNAALAESQQQFDALKRQQQQQGNRLMMPGATATSTHQQLLHQQLNSQAQAVSSQVISMIFPLFILFWTIFSF